MGQRHVAHAQAIDLAQHGERIADLMAALHAHQAGDTSGLVDTDNVVGRRREFEVVGITCGEPFHDVDLFKRCLHCRAAAHFGGDIHRPELPADVPRVQPCHVGLKRARQLVAVCRNIGRLDLRRVFLAQLPRQVVVPVNERRCLQNSVDTCLDSRIDGRHSLSSERRPKTCKQCSYRT